MTSDETNALFIKAYESLTKSKKGKFRIIPALKAAGIENTVSNRIRLKKMTGWSERGDSTKRFYFGAGVDHLSMPLGQNALDLGWKNVQQPAVYAIINSKSGRMYVGSSTRPDLRRAVHLYWLKNYWRWGTSNVFFGLPVVAADIQEHGVESFYMEILKTCPDADAKELMQEEAQIARNIPACKIYNLRDFSKATLHVTRFDQIEPEFAELNARYWSEHEHLMRMELRYAKMLARKKDAMSKLERDLAQGTIDNTSYRKKVYAIRAKMRGHRQFMSELRKQDISLRKHVKSERNELCKKYKNALAPLY